MTPTTPFFSLANLQYQGRRARRAAGRFFGGILSALAGIFMAIGVIAFVLIVPAIQSLIGALLVSLPVWFVAWWLLFWAKSSYLPADWWSGYWLCVVALFILAVYRKVTGADNPS